jgi:hypothetical protein
MKKSEKIGLFIGTIAVILFILVGIPKIGEALEPVIGFNIKMVLYIVILLGMYLVGRKRGSRYKKIDKQLDDLNRDLINNHRIDYYIIQNKRLYKEVDNKTYRTMFLINIATAYYHDGQYEKSNGVIDKIDKEYLNEGQMAAIYNQQFSNYMHLGQMDKAQAVYTEHEELFQKYEDDKKLKNHYVISKLTFDLEKGKMQEQEVARIRKEFDEISIPQKSYEKAYSYRLLEGKLLLAEGKRQEGRENLRKLSKDFIMPGMKKEIEALLAE